MKPESPETDFAEYYITECHQIFGRPFLALVLCIFPLLWCIARHQPNGACWRSREKEGRKKQRDGWFVGLVDVEAKLKLETIETPLDASDVGAIFHRLNLHTK